MVAMHLGRGNVAVTICCNRAGILHGTFPTHSTAVRSAVQDSEDLFSDQAGLKRDLVRDHVHKR